jgi:hypothetical protein
MYEVDRQSGIAVPLHNPVQYVASNSQEMTSYRRSLNKGEKENPIILKKVVAHI